MPRLNTSRQVKQRTRQLLEKLLSFANYELPESEYFLDKLMVRWKNETTSAPELVVETELKVLIQLAFEQEENPKLKDQLRNDLRVLEEFLQILEDNRARTQGAKHWRFTLKLWDKSTEANLEAFEKYWDQHKKRKSKRSRYDSINVPNLANHPTSEKANPDNPESKIQEPLPEPDLGEIPLDKPSQGFEDQLSSAPVNASSPQTTASQVRYINLNAQTSSYSVNQSYLNRLITLLSFDEPAHLITLEGIGGVGKTTLALEAAQHCLRSSQAQELQGNVPKFEAIIFTSAQTQHFMGPELSPRLGRQRNLQDIFRTIFRTLERSSTVPPDFNEQLEYIRDCLGQQRTLLIVDNLETLEDRDIVLSFLKEIPLGVKVIVTSRVRLGLGTTLHIDPLSTQAAVALIKQQADELDICLIPDQAKQIYDQTGGLPLAITYTLGMISAYGLRPDDINSGQLAEPQGDFARHCFEASVQRLRGQASHELLKAFALFRRPALPEALAHVAFPSDHQRNKPKVFKDLYRLSLIESQLGRYTMHSLTREYARAELTQDQSFAQEAQERWVEWYLEFLTINGQEDWYDWHPRSPIEDEWENLREVIEWCQSQDRYDTFLCFWDYLRGYTQIYGHWNERLDWMKWLMKESEKRLDKNTMAVAMYHYSRTLFFFDQSRFRNEAIEIAYRIWEMADLDNWKLLADVAILLSTLYANGKQYKQALDWIDRGQKLLDQAEITERNKAHQWVNVPYYQAEIYAKNKEYAKAQLSYNVALERAQQINWGRGCGYIQGALGVVAIETGDFSTADQRLHTLLKAAQSHQDVRCLAFCYSHLARLEKNRKKLEVSSEYARLAKNYFDKLNMKEQSNEMQSLLKDVVDEK